MIVNTSSILVVHLNGQVTLDGAPWPGGILNYAFAEHLAILASSNPHTLDPRGADRNSKGEPMALTAEQQPFLDDLVKAFGIFVTGVGGPYVAPAPTLGQGPGTFPVPVPAPVVGYWRPTPEQYAAFASRLGVSVLSISPVLDDVDATGAFAVLPAVTAIADILEYAGFGYGPDGIQRLYHVGEFATRRRICDQAALATTEAEANAVVAGGSGCEPDSVRLSLMTRLAVVGPLGQATMGGGKTVADVVAILNGQNVSPAGQGPGGL